MLYQFEEDADVGGWWTVLYLEGFPNMRFNSVCFEQCDE